MLGSCLDAGPFSDVFPQLPISIRIPFSQSHYHILSATRNILESPRVQVDLSAHLHRLGWCLPIILMGVKKGRKSKKKKRDGWDAIKVKVYLTVCISSASISGILEYRGPEQSGLYSLFFFVYLRYSQGRIEKETSTVILSISIDLQGPMNHNGNWQEN